MPTTCTINDCDRAFSAKGMCKAHYERARNGLDTTPAIRPRSPNCPGARCTVVGCEKPHKGYGLCNMHYRRFKTHGDTHTVLHSQEMRGTDDIGYGSAHKRVRAARGEASGYPCAHCGGVSTQWAYTHNAVNERHQLVGKYVLPYSIEPADYITLCRPCHARYDL